MKFLGSVGAKARSNRNALQGDPSVARSTGLQSWQYNRMPTHYSYAGNPQQAVRDAYEMTTWVFRAVEAIAYNGASLKMVCRQDDPQDGKEIDHALLPLLNWRASPFTREQAFVFRVRLASQLLLSSKGVFIEVIRNNAGDPMALHLLPPHMTWPQPDPNTFVRSFIVMNGPNRWELPAENVVWLKRPHPLDPYRSFTPIEACGLAIDTDLLARLYNKRFMQNDGRPGGLIGVKGGVEDEDADELQAFFRGGVQHAGEWRVLDNIEGLDVVDMAKSPRDAQYIEQRKLTKEEILQAFGVPESLTGNASGRTYDNSGVERRIFWQETMLPHLELVGGGLDLIDDLPNTFMVFDTSVIDVLQETENRRKEDLRAEVDKGEATINEYRLATGRKPFDAPEADIPHLGISQTPLWSLEPTQPASAIASAPAPAANVPSGGQQPVGLVAVASLGVAPGVKTLDLKDRRVAAKQHFHRWEGIIDDTMRKFFLRQQKVVVARLAGKQGRRGTRHWKELDGTVGTKMIDIASIFESAKWDAELRADIEPILVRLFKEVGDATVANLTVDGVFNLHNPVVTEAISRRVNKISSINATTEGAIREEIKAGELAGESITDIAKRVSGVFSDASTSRARMIARTETIGASNEGSYIAATDSGVVATKAWLATEDDRTRPTHIEAEADGDIAMDETFSNGLLYPGDPDGDAGEVINCRCTSVFSAGGDAAGEEA